MPITILTPWALVLVAAIVAGVSVMVFVLRQRAKRAEALGFAVYRRPSTASVSALIAVVIVAVSAAQPALPGNRVRTARADAQVWIAIDTSNSMLARSSKNGPTRLKQAITFASALRGRLAGVPVGAAEMTDRVLPLLPPTSDQSVFETVLEHTVKADTPPPKGDFTGPVATTLDLLQQVPQQNFFGRASRRVLVLITDAETQPFPAASVAAGFRSKHEQLILVRAGTSHDRIWLNGRPDAYYQALKRTPAEVTQLVGLEHERLFTTSEVASVASQVRATVEHGPMVADGEQPVYRALAPFLLLAALPFLVFTLTVYLGGLRARPGSQDV